MPQALTQLSEQDVEFVDFVEQSVLTVDALTKQAFAEKSRADAAELRVQELERQLTAKQASASPFDDKRLEDLGNLLHMAGITKRSAEEVRDLVQAQPDVMIDMFQSFLNDEVDQGGELTSMKVASQYKQNLWRQAAVQK